MNITELPLEIHIQIFSHLSPVGFELLSSTNKYFYDLVNGNVSADYGDILPRIYCEKVPFKLHEFKEENMNWREFYLRIVKFHKMLIKFHLSSTYLAKMLINCDMMEIRILEKLYNLKPVNSTYVYMATYPYGSGRALNNHHFDMNNNIAKLNLSVLRWFFEKEILPDTHGMKLLCENGHLDKIALCCEFGILPGVSAINSLLSNCNIEVLNYLKQRSPKIILETQNINSAYHTKNFKIIDWILKNEGYPNNETIRSIINDRNIKVLKYLNNLDPPVKFEEAIIDFAFTNNTTIEILQFFFDMKLFPTDVGIRRAIQYGLFKEIEFLYRYRPHIYNINHLHIALHYGKTKLFKWLYAHIDETELTESAEETANLAIKCKRTDLLKLISK